MIPTPESLVAAAAAALSERFPDDPHAPYTNLVPQNFQRPSNMAECPRWGMTQVSASDVELTYTLTVRTFVTVDERHFSHFELLYARQAALFSLFATGSFPAAGRKLSIRSVSGTNELDYAEVTAELRCLVSREEFNPSAVAQMMQEIALRLER